MMKHVKISFDTNFIYSYNQREANLYNLQVDFVLPN